MNIEDRNFQNSLRCLQHPITWICIALLLVNDHFLKVVYPSWVTGKLSDFSGLFFFPFIVAAILSLLLSKFKLANDSIGQIAFGLVGGWFILLKIIPLANSLTAHLLSSLIGFSVHFTLDPTDLISIFALLPAWKIWKQPHSIKITSIAYVALILGSFAAMATSPRQPIVNKVTNLEYYKDGIVYAADKEGWGEDFYPVAESLDGGLTWQDAIDITRIEEKGLPIKLCSHLNPEICYQVTKSKKLQELADDGTWTNIQPRNVYDLILFEWEGKEYIIAAMGEYGIWRRVLPYGEWTQISVLKADTP